MAGEPGTTGGAAAAPASSAAAPPNKALEQTHGFRDYYRVLAANRQFRFLWFSEMIDNIGSWLVRRLGREAQRQACNWEWLECASSSRLPHAPMPTTHHPPPTSCTAVVRGHPGAGGAVQRRQRAGHLGGCHHPIHAVTPAGPRVRRGGRQVRGWLCDGGLLLPADR